jgi:colicin import membrane protein
MTKGAKQAPKLEIPKPLVEKIADAKPAEEIAPKLTEKQELKATAEKTPEPQPLPKPDPIAEKLKKQDEQKQQAKAEPQPLPPKKPVQKQPKFDADKIAALLDKRDPQRNAATGAELNSTPSLGAASGNAARLSQSEIDALRARLMSLWNPPVGAQDADQFQVTIRIRFKRDGTLDIGPQVMTSGSGARFNAIRDSAVRAVLIGQPFTMLRPDHYDIWKEIDFTFDTKEMFSNIPAR